MNITPCRMTRAIRFIGLAAALLNLSFALAAAGPPAQDVLPVPVALQVDAMVPVPMRDGVRLSAWVYRDARAPAPMPVILSVTPYAMDQLHARGRYFAENGYVFVAVSTRGRGDSEGRFAPFSASDGADAADAIAWSAVQPWANGRVGMWGGSYAGYNQWAAAAQRPPALRTIVPAAAVFPGVDYPAYNGVRFTYAAQWLAGTSGRATHFNYAYDTSLWAQRMRGYHAGGGSYLDLADYAAGNVDLFRRWLDEPQASAAFAAAVPATGQWHNIDIPVLTITGSYDADQRGALEYMRRHEPATVATNPTRRSNHWLLFGPWDHGGTRTPGPVMNGVPVGPAALIDMNALHKAWYDWTLKDGDRPALLKEAVTYYVLGDDRWSHAASLQAMGPRAWRLQLAAAGPARQFGGPGLLLDVAPNAAQRQGFVIPPGSADRAARTPVDPDGLNRQVIDAIEGDGLVYESPALPSMVTLAGAPELTAWLSIDRPDADLYASLHELRPDGSAVLLSHDVLRARHRNGLDRHEPLRSREPERYVFRHFTHIVKTLEAGSRLRLVLHGNPPLAFERNHGLGGDVATERRSDLRGTRVELHSGPGRPAELRLPMKERMQFEPAS